MKIIISNRLILILKFLWSLIILLLTLFGFKVFHLALFRLIYEAMVLWFVTFLMSLSFDRIIVLMELMVHELLLLIILDWMDGVWAYLIFELISPIRFEIIIKVSLWHFCDTHLIDLNWKRIFSCMIIVWHWSTLWSLYQDNIFFFLWRNTLRILVYFELDQTSYLMNFSLFVNLRAS